MTGPTSLTGLATLIGAIIRRDRIRLALAALSVPILHGVLIVAFNGVFTDDPDSLTARAMMARTPSVALFAGPGYGADDYTLDVLFASEMTLYYLIVLALGAASLVIRQTREDEERGAYELIGATPVGRFAATTASAITVSVAMLISGFLISVASVLIGGFDPASSFAFGMGIAACAVSFAALACLTAQLAASAKAALMSAMLATGAAFILRAFGDLWGLTRDTPRSWSVLSFCSPLAWVQQARPFVDLRVWPVLLYIPLTLILIVLAFVVQSRRDYGRGVFAARLGRAAAAPTLTGTLALNLRLIRANWCNWAGFTMVFCAVCGPLMSDIQSYMTSNPELARYLGLPPDAAGELIVATFIAMLVWFAALFGVCFALGALGRFRSDEASGLLELQLAYPVARTRLLAVHASIGLAGATAITWLGSLGLALTIPADYRHAQSVLGYSLDLAAKSLAYVPALALSVAVAVLLTGLAPKLLWINWVLLSWGVIGYLFGAALGLPQWAVKLSPIAATPQVPMIEISATPLVVMSVLAVFGCAVGAAALRRRNISSA